MDGGDKIAAGDRLALVVGDRHQGHFAKTEVKRFEIVEILSAVQRRYGAMSCWSEQGKVKLVDVEMQNVEFVGALAHPIEHQHVVWNRVPHIGVEPERHGGTGHEVGGGYRVAARKQRHIVTQLDQFVGQIRDNSLGSAVQLRRHTFPQRRDLRDFHCRHSFFDRHITIER